MALNQVGLERLNTATTKKIGTRKNLIINGAMQVSQRGTSSTLSSYRTVDRFITGHGGTDESPTQAQHTLTSSDTGPYAEGFRFSYHITNGNQTSGAGAADNIYIRQRIEAQNVATSGWDYTSTSSFITLQFWVKSSVAQNFYGYLRTADGTSQRYAFETGSLSANTWTKITKTVPGNSNLQIDNNNENGLEVVIIPFWGTDQTDPGVTLNAWGAFSTSTRTPDSTSTWYTTNDATFEITGVQLEVGSVATDFEHRSIGQELHLCKRYYQSYQPYYNAAQYLITNEIASNTVFFHPEMRATPTATHGQLECRENSDGFTAVSVSSNYLLNSKGINFVVTKTGAATSDSFIIFVNNAKYDAEL